MCVSILITTDVRYLVKESSREREIEYSVKKGQGNWKRKTTYKEDWSTGYRKQCREGQLIHMETYYCRRFIKYINI